MNNYIKVGYWVVNGGDGSANPQFTQTKEIAELAEKKDNEKFDGGWGESSAGELKIFIDGENNFYLREYEFIDGEMKYTYVELEVGYKGD